MRSRVDQSPCGCVWERGSITDDRDRAIGFGDRVVVQCARHGAEGRSERAHRAARAADALVERLRREGRVR